MIPEGTYAARAKVADLSETKAGKPQAVVAFELLEGEYAGKVLTWYGHFTEKTTERTLESLRNCGWSGDDVSDLSTATANEVEIVVEHEDDMNGQPRARVKWVNRPSSGLALKSRMPADKAKAFAQKMRGAVVAFNQKAPKPVSPKREEQDAGEGDDDVPF